LPRSLADLRKDLFEQQREALQHKKRSQKAEEMVATLRAHVTDLQNALSTNEADLSASSTAQTRLELENKQMQRDMQHIRQQLEAAKELGSKVLPRVLCIK
jgi:chromosome segregation ATPase